jgi:hypothetical protein
VNFLRCLLGLAGKIGESKLCPEADVALGEGDGLVLIGNSIFADEHIENVERMHKAYERCDFPQERLDCAFSTTSIYWKPKSEEEGEAKGKGIVIEEVEIENGEEKKESDEEEELLKKLEATTIN